MNNEQHDTGAIGFDRERHAGADGATGGFTWLPDQPVETIAEVGVLGDDAAFVDSVAADGDD
ncbi:MAG: hypothetical protein KIT89_09075 [Microcella sp.]|uniref:hypothetical protein n=1 Tax=Microcella sp. TaxID=1913979 RepID=UPI0024C5C1D1|nr:hypothetical protein [Microcella sp.]UYN82864.1 MAG: hypothetical protein KIT89_09075 [Microcella sp.]